VNLGTVTVAGEVPSLVLRDEFSRCSLWFWDCGSIYTALRMTLAIPLTIDFFNYKKVDDAGLGGIYSSIQTSLFTHNASIAWLEVRSGLSGTMRFIVGAEDPALLI
jgi:hypothetical protein